MRGKKKERGCTLWFCVVCLVSAKQTGQPPITKLLCSTSRHSNGQGRGYILHPSPCTAALTLLWLCVHTPRGDGKSLWYLLTTRDDIHTAWAVVEAIRAGPPDGFSLCTQPGTHLVAYEHMLLRCTCSSEAHAQTWLVRRAASKGSLEQKRSCTYNTSIPRGLCSVEIFYLGNEK